MLEIEDVHVFYGQIEAVKGISLTVNKGEIVTLIGANGAGKTTTLMAISGAIKARKGTIKFKGEVLNNFSADEIVKRGISLVPEGRKIFGKLSVKENLELGGFLRTKKQVIEQIEKVYAIFPVLKERINQFGGTLSGGEQQMLAIGRSLMSMPEILLLDEPSLGLSPIMEQTVFNVIKDINKAGTTMLLIEQNANLALKVSHRGYVIETGRVALKGKSSELLNDEKVKKSYLGEQ